MKNPLAPDAAYDTLFQIDFSLFPEREFLIIDVDNTLLKTFESEVEAQTVEFFVALRESGRIKGICLLSNVGLATENTLLRLDRIAWQMGAQYVPATVLRAKPHRRVFEMALQMMHTTADKTAVIGDQIFTDIRGGNMMGMYTVLVKPRGKDRWVTWIKRWQERRLARENKEKRSDL